MTETENTESEFQCNGDGFTDLTDTFVKLIVLPLTSAQRLGSATLNGIGFEDFALALELYYKFFASFANGGAYLLSALSYFAEEYEMKELFCTAVEYLSIGIVLLEPLVKQAAEAAEEANA